ncbi:hypothetical protein M407DRAFT_26700 [Tulasnella calospora MUT 4182]|uniref:Uncharacterized protein n=1 Tax=Tulasnella calospora MUT 4182 TaxID=1051891 RepID=A0A0C3QFB7_9AGAM|nr:hypothetical protein M407DRAFT_26700 [Tulasnella calospora MUT 4182]
MAEPLDIPGVYASLPDDASSAEQKPISSHTDTSKPGIKSFTGLQFSAESEPTTSAPGNQEAQIDPNESFIHLVDDLPDDFVQP